MRTLGSCARSLFTIAALLATIAAPALAQVHPLAPGGNAAIRVATPARIVPQAPVHAPVGPDLSVGSLLPGLATCGPVTVAREIVTADIAHYTYGVRTGPGKYDRIRVHRVVRETRPGQPIKAAKNLFFQHGDCKDFMGMCLPGLLSPAPARDFGFAVFLAKNGVDVWGIDQSWTLVPETETDFTFMAGWDVGHAMQDLRLGITIARAIRFATGSGPGPMILSGYSSGVYSTVALLNDETRLPPVLRQVDGYIPVDCPIKSNDPAVQQAFITDLALEDGLLAAGQYGAFIPFRMLGQLARSAPDDDSPLVPGFTNLQIALYFSFSPDATPPFPYHYWAGILDPDGMPTGPRFVDREVWLNFLETAIVWQPVRFFRDYDILISNVSDSPYDDHLGQVRVPVLEVASGGGFGGRTAYGVSLLGSTDVQHLIASVGPPIESDFAHIDLFTTTMAQELFWRPVLDWITDHAGGRVTPHLGAGPVAAEAATPSPPPSLAFLGSSPNPARGEFRLDFVLADRSPASLEVVDVAGRLVQSLEVGGLGPGRHQVVLNDGARLSPGVYFVRLGQSGRSLTRRVALVP